MNCPRHGVEDRTFACAWSIQAKWSGHESRFFLLRWSRFPFAVQWRFVRRRTDLPWDVGLHACLVRPDASVRVRSLAGQWDAGRRTETRSSYPCLFRFKR